MTAPAERASPAQSPGRLASATIPFTYHAVPDIESRNAREKDGSPCPSRALLWSYTWAYLEPVSLRCAPDCSKCTMPVSAARRHSGFVGPLLMQKPFDDFYAGKSVMVTGDTGFKGSWLSIWLTRLGARVVGYALEPPSEPSNFAVCDLGSRLKHTQADVRDFDSLLSFMHEHQPSIVFHLAAQSLVRYSFKHPKQTFDVNVMGTTNVLQAARQTDSVTTVVAITSDKCYRNVEWEWGYRETDRLGGYDAYGASKACAELVIEAYRDSKFQDVTEPIRRVAVASARAGNVIGGGDWALDRIVPDAVRAIVANEPLTLRNPLATRPWQHVLEPLSGYLWLGRLLNQNPVLFSDAWNFGPSPGNIYSVQQLIERLYARWGNSKSDIQIASGTTVGESHLLALDCSKARHHMGWEATWTIDETADAIANWYRTFYEERPDDMYEFTVKQIERYENAAHNRGQRWASPNVDENDVAADHG